MLVNTVKKIPMKCSPEISLNEQKVNKDQRNVCDLINIFNRLFYKSTHTKLIMGDSEPIYLPKDEKCTYNRIIFAHGYFSSALHEISHWCLAGDKRRQLVDYGYWYVPDGRTVKQQMEFEQVEVKPQALEWLFSLASGVKFNISFDNLSSANDKSAARESQFKDRVYSQSLKYYEDGTPDRAQMLIEALLDRYNRKVYWNAANLSRHDI